MNSWCTVLFSYLHITLQGIRII